MQNDMRPFFMPLCCHRIFLGAGVNREGMRRVDLYIIHYRYNFNTDMRTKGLLMAAAAMVCGATAWGQSILLDDPANRSYVGIRAGLDISSPTPDVFKNGAGFHVGAIYNAKIIKNFYIEPGAMLYYDTWSLNDKRFQADLAGAKRDIGLNSSFRNFGVRIPLMFGYHFDFTPDINVSVFTGPELNIGLSSRYHYDVSVGSVPGLDVNGSISCYSPIGENKTGNEAVDKLLDQVQDLFHRVDCAWKIGVGLNYSNFHVSVGGAIGMSNVYKHSNASAFTDDAFRMNRMTVTLGYNF